MIKCPSSIKIKQANMFSIFRNADSITFPIMGLGSGLVLRGTMQPRNIAKTDNLEDSLEYKLYQNAPLAGTLAGFAASPFWRPVIKHLGKSMVKILAKEKMGELNSDVKLHPHQEDAINFILKNRHGIIAHGTGLGKTLTSIGAFEKLKNEGKATKALIIVPASLRGNYAKNIKEFTNSTYSFYGPKNDNESLNIEDNSDSDYSIISYEMFKKDPEGIKARTGADTLIIDEVHRARSEDSQTYKELSDQAPNYDNIITLTGSLVNNQPSDVAPLIDITLGKDKNTLGNKKVFDKLFVRKTEKIHGIFNPKTETEQKIINKEQLSKALENIVHYRSHEDMGEGLPGKDEEIVRVPMSDLQKKLYLYSLSALDPITRLKIRNNIPVSQREMSGIFSTLIQGRKVMTDPSAMYDPLIGQDPYEYSPKVKRVVDDLESHLAEDEKNKVVIYGNLLKSQINTVSDALDKKEIPYTTFYGIGNKDNSSKQRVQNIQDYMDGKKRVLLISGAGGEGLDLKGSSMMQMLEGHYNPEKIQQAEARIRRMGDIREDPIKIKKYVSYIEAKGIAKALASIGVKAPTSIDEYIYNVAKRKNDLNEDFRSVLRTKNAGDYDYLASRIGYEAGKSTNDLLAKRHGLESERVIKQLLHDKNLSEYAANKHLNKIKSISKIDERDAEIDMGGALLGITAAPYFATKINRLLPSTKSNLASALISAAAGAGIAYGASRVPKLIYLHRIGKSNDIERAIDVYEDKLRKKVERKIRSSRDYLDRADRVDSLGIDRKILEV